MDQTRTDVCYRCGYNLTSIADDRPCPECGLLAERSRRVTDELHQTRPLWLRRLSRGVWLIILAVLLPVPLGLTARVAAENWVPFAWWTSTGTWTLALLPHLFLAPADLPLILLSVGVLLLASREGHPPADQADARIRRFLRISLAGPWAAVAILHAMMVMATAPAIGASRSSYNLVSYLESFAIAAAMFGSMPLVILLGVRLRALARRLRSARLAEHCLIVGVGVALTLGCAFAAAIVNEYAESWGWKSQWSTGTASLIAGVALATLGVLFVLWALYLLIRFAVAFGLAARRLRRQWRNDDRAAVPEQLPHRA